MVTQLVDRILTVAEPNTLVPYFPTFRLFNNYCTNVSKVLWEQSGWLPAIIDIGFGGTNITGCF